MPCRDPHTFLRHCLKPTSHLEANKKLGNTFLKYPLHREHCVLVTGPWKLGGQDVTKYPQQDMGKEATGGSRLRAELDPRRAPGSWVQLLFLLAGGCHALDNISGHICCNGQCREWAKLIRKSLLPT